MSNWFGGANADVTANDLFASRQGARNHLRLTRWQWIPVQSLGMGEQSQRSQNMEDAIVDDLVPYVDAHYRTIADPANRTLAGISDGGYGAANIALHHPDVFGKVLSLGGFFMADKSAVFGTAR